MKRISVDGICTIHERTLALYGGEPGTRDQGLLESSTMSPYQTFDGYDLYATTPEKSSALIRSLIQNHPFVDGNKRTGMLAGLILLTINGYRFSTVSTEIERVGFGVADGSIGLMDLNAWINHIIT